MLVVVAIVATLIAISFPAFSSGLDSIRLNTASDSLVSFLNAGLNRADRRQQPIEIVISIEGNNLEMRSPDPAFIRKLEMPEGVQIDRIHPVPPDGSEEKFRSIILYPAGAVPRIGVEIRNRKGSRNIVRVDPITGIARIESRSPGAEPGS